MSKQLINLIGAVAAIAVLAAGILLFALPAYSQSRSTHAEADTVAASNAAQQTLLSDLQAQAAQMDQLEAEVAVLREQIPGDPQGDDVVLLAAEAAGALGATLRSVSVGVSEPYSPRVSETATDTAGTDTDAAAADAVTTDGGATTGGTVAAEGSATEQVPITVSADVADIATATAFVDALRNGPRLVAITQATVTEGGESGASVTVTLLAFYSS